MGVSRRAIRLPSGGETMMMTMPPRPLFFRRMARNASIAIGVIGGGLVIGMIGYHWLGRLSWQESFYYSAMILFLGAEFTRVTALSNGGRDFTPLAEDEKRTV